MPLGSDKPSREDEPPPPAFAIRLTPRARADVEAAYAWFVETASQEIADLWIAGFFDAIASLAHSPRRMSAAPESDLLKFEVRQMLYARRGSRVVYKVLFTVNEPADDAPFVRIVHVRHGARRPLTRRESREILDE